MLKQFNYLQAVGGVVETVKTPLFKVIYPTSPDS
jgi:hypothetical protein